MKTHDCISETEGNTLRNFNSNAMSALRHVSLVVSVYKAILRVGAVKTRRTKCIHAGMNTRLSSPF